MKQNLKLYLVTDRDLSLGRSLEEVVREAVAGGVTMVQLREKDASTGEFVELGRKLMTVLKPLGVPLIINDRVDVALAVDADGVHIGQSDMPYADARRLLGHDKIIGLSVENFEDLDIANTLDVDYVGISPVYGTSTKTDTGRESTRPRRSSTKTRRRLVRQNATWKEYVLYMNKTLPVNLIWIMP